MNREAKVETLLAVLRLLASFALLIGIVSFVGWAFRGELSRFGAWFIGHFGLGGILGGAFLADSLHFPIPPQFYVLTGIAAGHRAALVVMAVLVGSELGGFTAFVLAREVGARAPNVARRLDKTRQLIANLIERRGYFGLALVALLPVSYSLLCMATGAMRLPFKAYGVLALMRVPRLLVTCAVIVLAWHP